jgi:hypothetical protein
LLPFFGLYELKDPLRRNAKLSRKVADTLTYRISLSDLLIALPRGQLWRIALLIIDYDKDEVLGFVLTR